MIKEQKKIETQLPAARYIALLAFRCHPLHARSNLNTGSTNIIRMLLYCPLTEIPKMGAEKHANLSHRGEFTATSRYAA